jgi:hypothetical protein
MKNLFLIVTTITAIGRMAHADACALHLPSFELTGFPISRLQVAVLGAAQVEESTIPSPPMLTDMAASPHQIAVLTPRPKPRIVEASADPSLVTVGLAKPRSENRTGQALCAPE